MAFRGGHMKSMGSMKSREKEYQVSAAFIAKTEKLVKMEQASIIRE